MKAVLQAAFAAFFLAVSVSGQPGSLSLTVTNSLNFLYIDNIQYTPLPNGGDWRTVDTVDMETYARLVAIRGNNVVGGCSGIMVAASNMPLGYDFVSDSSWKCSASAPSGWEFLGFDDSDWTPAFEVGRNGQVIPGCSWIPLSGMPTTAYWIWTDLHLDGDMVVSCRGYTPVCQHNPCENGGTCQENAQDLCLCPVRYGGRFCQLDINECDSNPCQNGGQCELNDNGYVCNCGIGYSGVNCETDITDCASAPCQNGGTCNFDVEGGYTCSCPDGFNGLDCEINIDECESEPCANNGTCTDGINEVSCECLPGFSGVLCQININECQSNPCQNGGTCTDMDNGYLCQCYGGYEGDNCETPIGDCVSNPCLNGGTCTLDGGAVECLCTPGWSGALCDSNEDECASAPCENGGSCVDLDDGYECNCTPNFEGATCSDVVPNCGSIMADSIYPPARNFWVLCQINIIDHADYLSVPCRDLITGINYYNDSSTILAMGGTFGCYPTKYPDEMADSACVPGYNQDGTLGACLSCTHMGVCINVP